MTTHKVVPTEPTHEMFKAVENKLDITEGGKVTRISLERVTMIYKAMLSAAPAPSGEAVAWLIEWRDCGAADRASSKRRSVHLHNAIGDYRALDPDATVTPLYTHPPAERDAWQPIETAPKDGRRFFAWRAHSTLPLIVRWDAVYDSAENEFGEHVYHLTHWHPLPAAPDVARQGEGK